jgi:putative oligomerization/nucleic acid binding protein/phospholipase D-like protein
MTNYPLLDIFLSTLYFFIWILWIMLLFWILMDIFRSDDLGGWGKAGWVIFVIILPFLGVFVYLIARGHSMGERQARDAQARDDQFRAYVKDAAGPGQSQSDELAKLAGLHQQGVLSDQEFEAAKAKVLAA